MELVRQEFNGAVGDVAARDIINHHHTHGRLLTKAERIDLNKLVQQLEGEFGEPGWQTWKFLHRTIGVEKIDEMRLGHRDQAETILTLLLEKAAHKKAYDTHAEKLSQYATANAALSAQSKDLSQKYLHLQQAYRTLESRLTAGRKASACQQCQELTEALASARAAQERGNRPARVCSQCHTARAAIARSRRITILCCLLAVVSLPTAAYFSYQAIRKGTAVQLAEARLQMCEYNGKSYGLGSIVDSPGTPDLECALPNGASAPQWRAFKPSGGGNKKSAMIGRRPHREDAGLTKVNGNAALNAE